GGDGAVRTLMHHRGERLHLDGREEGSGGRWDDAYAIHVMDLKDLNLVYN
ncbi:hypothetical protein A2U01_0093918, partial [Trifolium medium]|nr:hypothetical protein [Trifolium medium]